MTATIGEQRVGISLSGPGLADCRSDRGAWLRILYAAGLFFFSVSYLARDSEAQPTHGRIVTIPMIAGKVKGRVLFEGQDIHQPPVAAEHVKVQLEDQQTGEVLHEVTTDKEGNFSLFLEGPGEFLLRIGRLKIKIRAEPSEEDVTPKQVVFVIPRLLAR